MDYEDFVIQLGTGPLGPTVRVARSPAGESEVESLSLALIDGEIVHLEKELGRVLEPECQDRDLLPSGAAAGLPVSEIGARLFHALFPETVRSIYERSLGRVAERRRGLRIRIEIGLGSAELARLQAIPWEYLAYKGDFLGLSREISIVRHLPLGLPSDRPPALPPLSVLVLAGETFKGTELKLGEEQRALEQAWSEPGFTSARVNLLPDCTLDGLRDELLALEYHVLHFMGHGSISPATGEGVLSFRTQEGRRAWVSGAELAAELRDRTSLRLVFLNACKTAKFSLAAPYTGVATALLRVGIPAVVAMQFPISDAAAVILGRTFYRRIARGDTIDAAVTEGRMAIRRMHSEDIEWATPVLFERLTSGQLLEPRRRPWHERILSFSQLHLALAVVVLAGTFALAWFGLREPAERAPKPTPLTVAQLRTLRGEILDGATGNPLPGVLVQLPELRLQTITDTMGQYRLVVSSREIITVKLRATLDGYIPLNLDLTPGSDHLNVHRMLRTR